MNRKPLVLGLALILPIVLFLVLKFFGKNQFDVQPLFQQPIPSIPAECEPIEFPYVVNDNVMTEYGIHSQQLTIIIFVPKVDAHDISTQAKRVAEEIVKDPVSKVIISEAVQDFSNEYKTILLNKGDIDILRKCAFLLNDQMDAVVVDQSGNIRGQYDLDDLDDPDRLLLELDILLKKY